MSFYKNKKILITGGDGFIGSHLTELLIKSEAMITVVGKKKKPQNDHNKNNFNYISSNLLEFKECKKIVKDIDIVFQLSGLSGSVEYSAQNHSTLFTQNTLMNLNMLNAANESSVKFYQYISSVSVYPNKKSNLKEKEGFQDHPVDSHFGYGWAKRIGELQCKMFAEEFGMKISVIRPDNTFGPRDNFEPKQSRVIPSLIYRIFEADKEIQVWGTGNQKRTFVYVKDLVRGMLLGLEKYPKPDPINISSGIEITIKELVETIIKIFNKDIRINFDITKPESSLKRSVNITKSQKILGYESKWDLKEALEETIDWYKDMKNI